MGRTPNQIIRASRWRRRLGARLGLAALAGHLVVALAQAVPAAAAGIDAGVKSLITCVVYSGGADQRDTDKQQKKSRSDCPVCQTETLCKNLLPALASAAPRPMAVRMVRLAAPYRAFIENRTPSRQFARGPPRI